MERLNDIAANFIAQNTTDDLVVNPTISVMDTKTSGQNSARERSPQKNPTPGQLISKASSVAVEVTSKSKDTGFFFVVFFVFLTFLVLYRPQIFGRDREITELLTLVQSVRAGFPTMVLISGKEGTGKSILMKSVIMYAVSPLHWCHAQCTSNVQGNFTGNTSHMSPLSAVQSALKSLFLKKAESWTTREKVWWKNRILYSFSEKELHVVDHLIPTLGILDDVIITNINFVLIFLASVFLGGNIRP